MRLLLVEDDHMIGESLAKGLRDEHYVVDWVREGPAALAALRDRHAGYSIAVLDWNLPRQDGLSVLRQMRADGNTLPVLMITARDELADRISGLDGGADDYLVKPFELGELKARLRSLLRRRDGRARTEMVHADLVLDPVTHTVRQGSGLVAVTAREFTLLRALMEHPGAVLSRSQLEERLYGWDDGVQSNAVEFTIHSLRRKLGPALIENVRGVGWRLSGTP
ncbi:MAG TPA: response regulator transcription factor [Steroidobacteraceae bacterium]|nr:response regulator transcription factor [Steroidobacteraceae bacterium]